jgi:hypothetical protein
MSVKPLMEVIEDANPSLGCYDNIAKVLNKQINAISLKRLVDERMRHAKFVFYEIKSAAHFAKLYAMLMTDGVKDMSLHQVDE